MGYGNCLCDPFVHCLDMNNERLRSNKMDGLALNEFGMQF